VLSVRTRLPLVAGGVAGLAVGVAAWKGFKHLTKKPEYKKYEPTLIDSPKQYFKLYNLMILLEFGGI
jgi:hypothetical protein